MTAPGMCVCVIACMCVCGFVRALLLVWQTSLSCSVRPVLAMDGFRQSCLRGCLFFTLAVPASVQLCFLSGPEGPAPTPPTHASQPPSPLPSRSEASSFVEQRFW